MRKVSKPLDTRADSSASSSGDSSDDVSETNAKVSNGAGKKDGANDLEGVKNKSQDGQDGQDTKSKTNSRKKENLQEQKDGNNKRKRSSKDESESSGNSDTSDDEALSKMAKPPVEKSSKGKGNKKEKEHTSESEPAEKDGQGGDDAEYEVEEVVSHKKSHGQMLYLIRWKGFGSEDDTWENASTLDNCPDILKKYTESHPDSVLATSKGKSSKGSKNDKDKKFKKLKAIIAEPFDENADYEVERIIDVFFKKDQSREFLVRWKGYGKEYDTWEPENNLSCPDLIEKFMAKVEQAKRLTEKELRPNRKHTERFTLRTQTSERRLSKRHDGKQRAVYYDAED